MATKTTRCSISVKDSVYNRIKSYLDSHGGGSIAGFCEEVIAEKLGHPTEAEIQAFNAKERVQEHPTSEMPPVETPPLEVAPEMGIPLEVATTEQPLRLSRMPPTPARSVPDQTPLPDGWEDYVPPILIL